jgi:hypothetical protein
MYTSIIRQIANFQTSTEYFEFKNKLTGIDYNSRQLSGLNVDFLRNSVNNLINSISHIEESFSEEEKHFFNHPGLVRRYIMFVNTFNEGEINIIFHKNTPYQHNYIFNRDTLKNLLDNLTFDTTNNNLWFLRNRPLNSYVLINNINNVITSISELLNNNNDIDNNSAEYIQFTNNLENLINILKEDEYAYFFYSL